MPGDEDKKKPQTLADAIAALDSDGADAATPYKGLSVGALAAKFKAKELTEAEFRTELEARAANGDIGPKAIDALIKDNQPESLTSQIGAAAKESYQKDKSLDKLTEADILDGIKTGSTTAQQAYQTLITDKGYSAAAAQRTVEAYVAKQNEGQIPPEYKAAADDLKTKGIGKNTGAQNILAGVKKRLWSPDDAFKALIVYGDMSPEEAQAQIRLYFGIQGPLTPGVQLNPSQRSEITPPSVGSAGLAASGYSGGTGAGVGAGGDRAAFSQQMAPYVQKWSAQSGIPPEVLLAIMGSESNFGAAGSLFGIKGKSPSGLSSIYATHENVGGQNVNQDDEFATYNNPDEAFSHFINLVSTAPRYQSAYQRLQGGDWQGFLKGINQAGYATDPNWSDSIISLAGTLGGKPAAAPAAPKQPGVLIGGPLDEDNLKAQYG